MSLSQRWTVIGIFEEQSRAQQAIDELHQAGFNDDQIGFVYRNGEPTVSKADIEAEEETGAFKGGIIGGILGAADALLTPVLGPSVANTIPTTTMPFAEQTIERFQHSDADNEQGRVEPEGAATPDEAATGVDDDDTQTFRPSRGDNSAQGGVANDMSAENTQALRSPQDDNSVHIDHQMQNEAANEVSAENTQTLRSPQDDNPEQGDLQEQDDHRDKRLIEEETTGAVTGGIVGGVLGAAVALLLPVIGPALAGGILVTVFSAALGAVTGSLLGALVTMGVPEEMARHYEEEFTAGRTIVTVKTEDQQQKVLDIMYRNRVRYANAHDRS